MPLIKDYRIEDKPNVLSIYSLIPKEKSDGRKSVPGKSKIHDGELFWASDEDVVGKRLLFNGKKYDMSVDLAVDCMDYM